jgi:hypothetical protein
MVCGYLGFGFIFPGESLFHRGVRRFSDRRWNLIFPFGYLYAADALLDFVAPGFKFSCFPMSAS